MPVQETVHKKTGKIILENALRFSFNVGFSYFFQILFGIENILPSVAMCVGFTMIPGTDLGIRPLPMAITTFVLYVGSGIAAQAALLTPWAALPVNFLFTILILVLSTEPRLMKTSISFLLCFIFCQANPVPPEAFPMRLASLLTGSAIVAAGILIWWKKKHYGTNGRTFREQAKLCAKNHGYMMRMSLGLSIAMFIGMALHFTRPLWISIVVMSLTQIELTETVHRIKYRALATIVGGIIFTAVFAILVPRQYALVVILLIGYLSFFTTEYKYTQIANAICALNASLVLLDPGAALGTRFLCLAAGILIVLALWGFEKLMKASLRKRDTLLREIPEHR